MNRQAKIRIEILRTLKHTPDGYTLTDKALFADVRLSVHPHPTREEIEDQIMELEDKGMIKGTRNDLTDERKWMITDTGKLALSNV